jgi:hypothetical protein
MDALDIGADEPTRDFGVGIGCLRQPHERVAEESELRAAS